MNHRPFYVYFLLKQELKYLAQNLREWKQIRNQAAREHRTYLYSSACSEIQTQTIRYRHLHIATCLSKGRTYEQIEKPVRHNSNNGFNMGIVQNYKKWIDEALERGRNGQEPHLEAAGDIFCRDSALSPADLYRRNQERVARLQHEHA